MIVFHKPPTTILILGWQPPTTSIYKLWICDLTPVSHSSVNRLFYRKVKSDLTKTSKPCSCFTCLTKSFAVENLHHQTHDKLGSWADYIKFIRIINPRRKRGCKSLVYSCMNHLSLQYVKSCDIRTTFFKHVLPILNVPTVTMVTTISYHHRLPWLLTSHPPQRAYQGVPSPLSTHTKSTYGGQENVWARWLWYCTKKSRASQNSRRFPGKDCLHYKVTLGEFWCSYFSLANCWFVLRCTTLQFMLQFNCFYRMLIGQYLKLFLV